MSDIQDRIVSGALVVATLAIAGSVVYRNLAPAQVAGPPPLEKPTYVESWSGANRFGATIIGDQSASVTIVELTDLECPACRAYQPMLEGLVRRHRGDVRLVYLAYPLSSIHRFAMASAQAGDCALDGGAEPLLRWIEVIYRNQDSLGLRSWGSFAAEAGIADTGAIARCALDQTPRPRVAGSMAFGESLDITGTPTILVNGWLYRGMPPEATLDSLIEVLKGRNAVVTAAQ